MVAFQSTPCVRLITEQKLLTFALKPRGRVTRYHTDTGSQPGLEGSLYESTCVML